MSIVSLPATKGQVRFMFQRIKAEPHGDLDEVTFCTHCMERCVSTGEVIPGALRSKASLSLEVQTPTGSDQTCSQQDGSNFPQPPLNTVKYYHELCPGNQPDPGDIRDETVSLAGSQELCCLGPLLAVLTLWKSRLRHKRETEAEAEAVQRAALDFSGGPKAFT